MNRKVIYKQFRKYMTNLTNNSVSPNSKINSQNVTNLKELWKIETTSPVSSDPIIYYGNVYFTDWEGNAVCANKQTGKILWKIKVYSPPTPQTCEIDKIQLPPNLKSKYQKLASDVCIPYVWSGLAGTGVILGNVWYIVSIGGKEGPPLANQAPGRLYAIDINSKNIIWDVKVTDYQFGGCLAKLLIYDGIIYLGISGIDEGAAGVYKELKLEYHAETVVGVAAFDCITGKKIWERKTVGLLENDNLDAKGAGVWGSFALCPKCNMLYFGTGNNYGAPESKSSDSIVALDRKTGELIWQNQVKKENIWLPGDEEHPDDDFGAGPQIFEIKDKSGKIIPAVGMGNKDGYYYVFNRRNGSLIWSSKVYTGDDSGSGIRGNVAIANGYIYVWSNNGWDEEDPKDLPKFSITIACLDANTGETIWSKIQKSARAIGAGVLCNDVFLVGDMMGNIVGYRASNGNILWNTTIKDASIASSIIGNDNAIYVGVGVPNIYGGLPKKGLYAYSIM